MDLIIYFVDWKKAQAFKNSGSFAEEFERALGRKRSWVEAKYGAVAPLDAYYFEVAEAYQSLRKALPPEVQTLSDTFFQGLITPNGMCQDFGDDPYFRADREPGRFMHSVSPASAEKFAEIAHQIDWPSFRSAYEKNVKKAVRQNIADVSGASSLKHSFDEGFLPYIQQWISVLDEAFTRKRGFLATFE